MAKNKTAPSANVSGSRKRKATASSAVDGDAAGPKKRKTVAKPAKTATPNDAKRAVSRPHRPPPAPARAAPIALNRAPTQILTVLIFGTGDCGELGLGPSTKEVRRPRVHKYLDPDSPDSFHIVQLESGGMHVVALTRDNKIVTWGVNDKGALGRDTAWEGDLRTIDEAASDSDESADLNPRESIPMEVPADSFPPGTRFTQVAAGASCSFALTETGLVYGWGTFLNSEGRENFCHDVNGGFIKVQNKPLLITGLDKITQIACGANHALALDAKGCIWAWGVGEQNQLGRRILQRRVMDSYVPQRVEICRNKAKYIASGQFHSFATDARDNTWGWGLNSFGQAGYAKEAGNDSTNMVPYPMKIPELCGRGVRMLSGGGHHSAAVTEDGECLVWGRIDGGQLGVKLDEQQLADDTLVRRDDRGEPRICLRPVAVPGIGKTRCVSCSSGHTIFISEEGKAHSTGFGLMYQLGLGSEDDTETAQLVDNTAVRNRVLTWTRTGGQFSMVAGPAQQPGLPVQGGGEDNK